MVLFSIRRTCPLTAEVKWKRVARERTERGSAASVKSFPKRAFTRIGAKRVLTATATKEKQAKSEKSLWRVLR